MNDIEAIDRLKALDRMFEEVPSGAIEKAISALEKQIPKKPLQAKEYFWIDSVKHRGRYIDVRKKAYSHECPLCKKTVAKLSNVFCDHCGQALDWGDSQ